MSCCAQTFVLRYNGSNVGDELHGISIQPRLVEDVRERHGFWWSTAIIDAGYPAFVWEYLFPVYATKASRLAYVSWFADLVDMAGSGTGNLNSLLVRVGTDTVIDCGNCAFAGIEGQSDPERMLWYAAGIVDLKFLGTTKPVVTP